MERLLKGRDFRALEFLAGMSAGIQLLQLFQSIGRDMPEAIGGAHHEIVVHQHRHAVIGVMDVHFNIVIAHIDGFLDGGQGIFRRVCGNAAVR